MFAFVVTCNLLTFYIRKLLSKWIKHQSTLSNVSAYSLYQRNINFYDTCIYICQLFDKFASLRLLLSIFQ